MLTTAPIMIIRKGTMTLIHYIWWCLRGHSYMKGCANAIYIDSGNMNMGVLRGYG
jgi:hypothetical protein